MMRLHSWLSEAVRSRLTKKFEPAMNPMAVLAEVPRVVKIAASEGDPIWEGN